MKEATIKALDKTVDAIFLSRPVRKLSEIVDPYWDVSKGWASEYAGSWYTEVILKLGKRWHVKIVRTRLTHQEILDKQGYSK